MIYSTDDQHEEKIEHIYSDSSTAKLINENNISSPSRSVKAVKSTKSRLIPPAMQDETSCPSFDLHLYAHIDHSSLDRCVFTPIPHQTILSDDQSPKISRKRKFESADSANDCNKNIKFGNDNGELADIIYNMDTRLDELARTCNGLRSSIHTLTKMVTQLVHNQRQNNNGNEYDDMSSMRLPYVHSASSISPKSAPSRIKRSRDSTDAVSQRPTEFLCRLIRKVYSTNEIVAGITPDERLDRIKEAVADRYFPDEPERFESFWVREAHQSILGQARAQRCRDKKAGTFPPEN